MGRGLRWGGAEYLEGVGIMEGASREIVIFPRSGSQEPIFRLSRPDSQRDEVRRNGRMQGDDANSCMGDQRPGSGNTEEDVRSGRGVREGVRNQRRYRRAGGGH